MVAPFYTAGIDYSIPICYILTRGDGGPFYTAGILLHSSVLY